MMLSVMYLGGVVDVGIAEAAAEHHSPEALQRDAPIKQIVPEKVIEEE